MIEREKEKVRDIKINDKGSRKKKLFWGGAVH